MQPLPIGISDFKKLRENDYYYVDKSPLIKEVIDLGAEVLLLPRPRRFGKTLNISMLRYFFEKVDIDHSSLFRDLKIWKEGEYYTKRQGQYPVIFLTFKDIKDLSWESAYAKIQRLIIEEFDRHHQVQSTLSSSEQAFYDSIISKNASQDAFEDSLKFLAKFLARYYQNKVFILIDEYDSPIEMGYLNGYYDKIIHFMRNLLSGCLKDNPVLEKGILTGILRVAKESIFSGLNNLSVYSLLSEHFNQHFGLLEVEVQRMMMDYNLADKLEEVRHWYNGYNFGGVNVYNPWSILKYIEQGGSAEPYWVNTSSNELIIKIITEGDEVKEDLQILLQGSSIKKEIFENVVYQDFDHHPDSIWSLLLFSGNLGLVKEEKKQGRLFAELKLPNAEIRHLYETIVIGWFQKSMTNREIEGMFSSLIVGDTMIFESLFQKFIKNSMSYFDFGDEPERVYHAFVLGMLLYLNHRYEIKSNRESGFGRYDLTLIPKKPTDPGIIFEFKRATKAETIDNTAKKALEQIEQCQYTSELLAKGCKKILALGMAFQAKEVAINAKWLNIN